jgi:hypothetical protein
MQKGGRGGIVDMAFTITREVLDLNEFSLKDETKVAYEYLKSINLQVEVLI